MTSAKRLLVVPAVGNEPAGLEKYESHPVNGPLVIGMLSALKVFATTLFMLYVTLYLTPGWICSGVDN